MITGLHVRGHHPGHAEDQKAADHRCHRGVSQGLALAAAISLGRHQRGCHGDLFLHHLFDHRRLGHGGQLLLIGDLRGEGGAPGAGLIDKRLNGLVDGLGVAVGLGRLHFIRAEIRGQGGHERLDRALHGQLDQVAVAVAVALHRGSLLTLLLLWWGRPLLLGRLLLLGELSLGLLCNGRQLCILGQASSAALGGLLGLLLHLLLLGALLLFLSGLRRILRRRQAGILASLLEAPG